MPKLILIVEDDEPTRDIYASALQDRGFRVILATQGAEGVHLARRHQPDLILMDLRMPIMDGAQAIRYLRSDPQTSRIPVCAISAYERDGDAADESHPQGWDCFLTKPIEPRELVEEIERRVGPGRPPA
jgi:two-component system, cell cycle response regulator DivK